MTEIHLFTAAENKEKSGQELSPPAADDICPTIPILEQRLIEIDSAG